MGHSLFASLTFVCCVPALSTPALAAHHGQGLSHGYGHGDRHAVSHIAWHRVMPMQTETFGQGFYNYAPAMQTRRDSESGWQQNGWQQNAWQQNNWQPNGRSQRNRSRNAFGQGTFGQSSFGATGGFNQPYGELGGMASVQASANGIPASLVERVIKRESGGNPRAVSRGNYGLMQIRLGTARAMGFSGSAAELLDPQVNMTYAVRYLAGAYRAAGGNESRAVALYASGYHAQAKAQGFSPYASQPSWPGFARYQPGGFNNAEVYAYGNTTPVYRVRHYRHRAV